MCALLCLPAASVPAPDSCAHDIKLSLQKYAKTEGEYARINICVLVIIMTMTVVPQMKATA